ncbi:4Fe-4S ferredoxin [Clostridiales bacterium PH28_bin88]|nr:4Fe-4S ferredoxin [Clostridiales bacterium PH28_bin88]
MVIDLRRCIGCEACGVACKVENGVPVGVYRSWVNETETGKFPKVKNRFLPRLCNHCADPKCVSVCPTGATFQREDGIVAINQEKCVGCGLCVKACPYNARFLHPEKTNASKLKVVDKCTFCAHRVEEGMKPACVNTCPAGARIFGDLNDPNSEVAKLVAGNKVQQFHPETGLKPQVFYIESEVNVSELRYK